MPKSTTHTPTTKLNVPNLTVRERALYGTQAAWEAELQRRDDFLSTVEPVASLNEDTYPEWNPDAPLLYYGFGVTAADMRADKSIMAYAIGEDLLHDTKDEMFRIDLTILRVVRHLSKQCNHPVYLCTPYSKKYAFVIAVWRNWTLLDDFQGREETYKTLDVIKKAIDGPDQEPLWYYDSTDPDAQDVY